MYKLQNTCIYLVIVQVIVLERVLILPFIMQGEVGAATTVKKWTDFREQESYSGFPYAHWSLNSGPPVISVKPALRLPE